MPNEKIVAKLSDDYTEGGLTGFMSWERLAATFRLAGELKRNERITGFEATEYGLTVRLTTRPATEPVREEEQ
jgi:hypothetical protein